MERHGGDEGHAGWAGSVQLCISHGGKRACPCVLLCDKWLHHTLRLESIPLCQHRVTTGGLGPKPSLRLREPTEAKCRSVCRESLHPRLCPRPTVMGELPGSGLCVPGSRAWLSSQMCRSRREMRRWYEDSFTSNFSKYWLRRLLLLFPWLPPNAWAQVCWALGAGGVIYV